ncbi:hypothetical protein MSP8886_00324 [Marinomonas spartinae]|uniref:Uncharacterized protein n=1 Tax=Marinomonas spartinae TaxID=1792290 RepID=A0A1A8T2N0_9GAMM|nr:hypothetical protein [Marinomonas spartinae]SBS25599.1 hypothetical protein MSP8886_00324 [Marinomonas spartinae]
MPFTLTNSDIVGIFGFLAFLCLLFAIIMTIIYYFKIVRKIDNVLYKNGIDINNFDLFYARFILYKKAVFQPDVIEKRKNIFDPKLLSGMITSCDKKIMKWHSYFYRSSYILFAIALIVKELIIP